MKVKSSCSEIEVALREMRALAMAARANMASLVCLMDRLLKEMALRDESGMGSIGDLQQPVG